MLELVEILHREFVYVSYYFMVQLRQILGYWVLGMVVGSLVSVFAKEAIHRAVARLNPGKWGLWGILPAAALGIASPLCMYGTIPLAAALSRSGVRQDWLAAFMMSSILLNPQLLFYSTALGPVAFAVRLRSRNRKRNQRSAMTYNQYSARWVGLYRAIHSTEKAAATASP